MKRKTFLTIAAVVGALFAVYMIAAPAKMMEGMGSLFTQISGLIPGTIIHIVFAIGFILSLKNLTRKV